MTKYNVSKVAIFGAIIVGSIIYSTAKADVNLDQINRDSEKIINSEKNDSKNEFTQKMADFFEPVIGIPKSKLDEKKRKLLSIEKDQVGLLKCVDKLIKNHSGGYESVTIAQNHLISAMDENGSLITNDGLLLMLKDNCSGLYSGLNRYSDKEIDQDKLNDIISSLPEKTKAEKVSKMLVQTFISKKSVCEVRSATANAALLFGATAGGSLVKCYHEDGSIKKYIGPQAGFLFAGFGYSVSIGDLTYRSVNGHNSAIATHSSADISDGVMLVFDETDTAGSSQEVKKGISLGVFGALDKYEGGVAFRFFNGFRRWDLILDKVNSMSESLNK